MVLFPFVLQIDPRLRTGAANNCRSLCGGYYRSTPYPSLRYFKSATSWDVKSSLDIYPVVMKMGSLKHFFTCQKVDTCRYTFGNVLDVSAERVGSLLYVRVKQHVLHSNYPSMKLIRPKTRKNETVKRRVCIFSAMQRNGPYQGNCRSQETDNPGP